MHIRISAILMMATLAFACGGGEGAPSEEAAAESMPAMEAAPIQAPTGEIDAALVSAGETAFQQKGCVGCHTVGGGRLTGPDLQGVTDRRSYEWFMAIVLKPDSMLQNDATAKQLLAEYMTPMVYMGTTEQEARAIYEYLRQ
ncbi:MAG: cytochrome c [Gemmatimonadota bacterium]|nr:MAG: cytochrome c [Gemmatimonadota bacterium]